jgi:hypothetical protein
MCKSVSGKHSCQCLIKREWLLVPPRCAARLLSSGWVFAKSGAEVFELPPNACRAFLQVSVRFCSAATRHLTKIFLAALRTAMPSLRVATAFDSGFRKFERIANHEGRLASKRPYVSDMNHLDSPAKLSNCSDIWIVARMPKLRLGSPTQHVVTQDTERWRLSEIIDYALHGRDTLRT